MSVKHTKLKIFIEIIQGVICRNEILTIFRRLKHQENRIMNG